MKKLLAILGAIGLTATTSSVVVACGTEHERIQNPTLNAETAKKIISKLIGKDINYDFGEMFNDSNIATTLTNWIDELVSETYNYEQTNSQLENLGLEKYESRKDLAGEYEKMSSTIAEDMLFNEYTKSLSTGNTPLDFSVSKQLFSLNVYKDTKIIDKDGEVKDVKAGSKIKFGDTFWSLWHEGGDLEAKYHLPTSADLSKEYTTGSESPFSVVGEDGKEIKISAKTALRLRFQEYFDKKIKIDIISNILSMVYNKSELFLNMGKEAYLNITSNVLGKAQKWSTNNNTQLTTNVKMVWSYKYHKDKDNEVKEIIKNMLNDGSIEDNNGVVKSGQKVSELINKFSEEVKSKNISFEGENAYDSFFGQQGFKGFQVYSGDSTIGDDVLSGDAYSSKIKEYNWRGGMLINSDPLVLPYFTNKTDKNIHEIVFVLPVYMIELLGGSNESKVDANEEAHSTTYNIKDSEGNKKAINLGFGSSYKDAYKESWNSNINKKLHSKDIEEISNDENKQAALFQQIQYLISKDSTTTEAAKKVIYTKYLDKEEIYYAGLYNQIGKYIKDGNDDDN